jgi:hypothetical protein
MQLREKTEKPCPVCESLLVLEVGRQAPIEGPKPVEPEEFDERDTAIQARALTCLRCGWTAPV